MRMLIDLELPKLEDYIDFLEDKLLRFEIGELQKYYERVVYAMRKNFEESSFLKQLNDNLRTYHQDYVQQNEYPLFSRIEPIEIKVKPFHSMLEKCYRQDVIDNPRWKEAEFNWDSAYVWIDPTTCFERFNDILRTRLSVRYLDGAIFLLEKTERLADSLNLKHSHRYKAEEEGYYAIHFYLTCPFEIQSKDSGLKKIESKVEVQINTEVQNLILDLSHKYYEERRMKKRNVDEKWQWDYDCEEFTPNYLGHIIHYIEGMIMEVRKRKQKETGK